MQLRKLLEFLSSFSGLLTAGTALVPGLSDLLGLQLAAAPDSRLAPFFPILGTIGAAAAVGFIHLARTEFASDSYARSRAIAGILVGGVSVWAFVILRVLWEPAPDSGLELVCLFLFSLGIAGFAFGFASFAYHAYQQRGLP